LPSQGALLLPAINDKRNRTTKMKNRILAIPAAPAAIPPKPNSAAINAITAKMIVHLNIKNNLKIKKLSD